MCSESNLFRGVMIPPMEQLTADGYDLQFGTNVLGRLTRLLKQLKKKKVLSYS